MSIVGRFKNYATTARDIAGGRTSFGDAWKAAKADPGGFIRHKKKRGGTKKHKAEVKGDFSSKVDYTQGTSGARTSGGRSYRSSSRSSGGRSYKSSKHSKDLLKEQKKAAEKRRKRMKEAYEKLYGTLRKNLLAQRDSSTRERDLALQGLETDYEVGRGRAQRAREESTRFFDDKEEELRNQYKDQRKERERIFTGRNIINSSYYIDAVTKADQEFNKTLGRLNEDEARTIAEQDAQLKELEQAKLQSRAKIESAYASAMRQIENNLAKTDFEKEEAMQRLQDEYDYKMSQINQDLITIKAQQQDFRDRVKKYAVSKKYQSNDYTYDINNQALKRKDLSLSEKIKQALMSGQYKPKKDEDENKARFISQDRSANQNAANLLTSLWLTSKK